MIERKYKIEFNKLVKRDSGVPLPDDEPVFILRAQDKRALPMLISYHILCNNVEHKGHLSKCIKDFQKFAIDHPDRMKEPD